MNKTVLGVSFFSIDNTHLLSIVWELISVVSRHSIQFFFVANPVCLMIHRSNLTWAHNGIVSNVLNTKVKYKEKEREPIKDVKMKKSRERKQENVTTKIPFVRLISIWFNLMMWKINEIITNKTITMTSFYYRK